MDELRGRNEPQTLDSPALRRVLTALEDAGQPSSTAQLARALGLHVTTVRSHLEQLERAGLVTRERSGDGRRGRPSYRYRTIHRDPQRARDELIRALATALATSPGGGADPALAAGRAWADKVPAPESDASSVLTSAFVELGFAPSPDGDVIRLRACPFRKAARAHPEVVCRVHLGMAQRLAERAGEGRATVELRPFVEPELCIVELLAPRH